MPRGYKPKRAVSVGPGRPQLDTAPDDNRARLIEALAGDDPKAFREIEAEIAGAIATVEGIKPASARDRLRDARRRLAHKS